MFVQRILLLFVLSFGVLAQVPAGSIDGRVTNAQTGDGVSSATVRLAPMRMPASGAALADATATTGADGSFHFDAVTPGTYFAVVESTGFVGANSRAALRPVSVSAGQQVSNVTISLMPQGTISGKVVDDEGNIQGGARVEAFAEHLIRGKAQLFRVSQTTADKSGVYSVRGLSPGKYYLVAEVGGQPKQQTKAATEKAQPPLDLVRTYYPKSLDLDGAGTVDVEAGQDLSGTNIELRRVLTHHIRGKVEGANGSAVQNDTLSLVPRAGIQSASFGRRGKLGADGRFDFDAVVPGEYTLRLIGGDPNTGSTSHYGPRRHLLARQDVEVGASDVEGIALAIIPPVTITGRVTLEGMDNPNFSQVHIALAPTADDLSFGSFQNARVAADGSFRLENLSPAKYVVHASGGPAGTYVRSLTFNGQNLLTEPMDLSEGGGGELSVSLHSGVAEVDGTVQSSSNPTSQIPLASPTGGQAASPFPMVILMPAKLAPDGTGWLVAQVQPSGSFTMQSVRPGEYIAFAVERFDGTLWQNPNFLREIQNEGISIDVGESDHKQIQLSAISNDQVQQASARAGIQ